MGNAGLYMVRRVGGTGTPERRVGQGSGVLVAPDLQEGARPTMVEDDPGAAAPVALADATAAQGPDPTLMWELMGTCATVHYRGAFNV